MGKRFMVSINAESRVLNNQLLNDFKKHGFGYFNCFGSTWLLVADDETVSAEDVLDIVQSRFEGFHAFVQEVKPDSDWHRFGQIVGKDANERHDWLQQFWSQKSTT